MNRTIKRCLLGLVTSATMFGIAGAQDSEPIGAVQLGPNTSALPPSPVGGQPLSPMQPVYPQSPVLPPSPDSLSSPPGSAQPGGFYQTGQSAPGSYQLSPVDRVLTPRFIVDSRGGSLYGYNAGYSNMGAFVPYKLDDTSLLFATGLGLVTYDGRGGATIGVGWRRWIEDLDRIIGLAVFADFDNGHAQPYQQLGFSFESLGRYTDIRVNGYAPLANATHVLGTQLTSTASLIGNGINLAQFNTVEQSYGGFDAEVGGPTPFLGRYGLNAYIGGYFYMGNGVLGGNFPGVSGRLVSQINEDVSFGVQCTNDHTFGLNTQFQVFMNLPSGKPGRWMRNLQVRDRLTQNVFRQNRVVAREATYTSQVAAIDPNTHKPYFVANIDPNAKVNGDGSVEHPFMSVAAYEAQSVAKQKQYDLILVRPGTALTNGNLNTNSIFNDTLNIYNNQRLLSTSSVATFTTENLPGVLIPVPVTTTGAPPVLFNSNPNPGNVVTLVGGNTQIEQISGFTIHGSSSRNGIGGTNNTAVLIDHNTISTAREGVSLTNLSGTFAAGTQFNFLSNTVTDNVTNGVHISNSNTAPLEVLITGNTFSRNGTGFSSQTGLGGGNGLWLDANTNSSIGGVIGGPNTAATATTPAVILGNTFDANRGFLGNLNAFNNVGNGLYLTGRNGGSLNFLSGTNSSFGIVNNTFTSNSNDGISINTTSPLTTTTFSYNIIANAFGTSSTNGNREFGIGMLTTGGDTSIVIGGANTTGVAAVTRSNTFVDNAVSAIDLATGGTAILNYNINNNSITNAATATTAAPHDAFTVLFDGTSGTAPFIVSNNSDAGVTITGITWNLAGTAATFLGGTTTSALIQPTGGSDTGTGLATVDTVAVLAGTNPLQISSNTLVANATNLAAAGATVAPFSTNLNLGFNPNGFGTGSKFSGTSVLEQSGGGVPLTSLATLGSSVNVQFSNGLSSTVKLANVASTDGLAVGASGTAFGVTTPGFGAGVDGIHINAGGASTLNQSIIQNNTITAYGNYGIHVETAGTANASNIVITGNTLQSNGTGVSGTGTPTFTGGGIDLSRNDSSTLEANISLNSITSNFNNGITLTSSGTTTGSFIVNTFNNNVTGNAGNGLNIFTGGVATLTYTSVADDFSGNGSTKNPSITGGDNIAIVENDTSVDNITLTNFTSNSAVGNGFSATTNNQSILNLNINTAGTGVNTVSNNGLSGLHFTGNDQSVMNINIANTTINNNSLDGILIKRNSQALILANITNTTLNSNQANGLAYLGIGSDPTDLVQQQVGTSNQINLVGVSMNQNGNSTTGVGDGALFDVFGQSSLIVNASVLNPGLPGARRTTFDGNAGNGMHVDLTPGSQFGTATSASTFDGIDASGNMANGLFFSSRVSSAPVGDIASRTFFQLTSLNAPSTINNNFNDGILLQYQGGHLTDANGNYQSAHSLLIQGNATNGVFIQQNGLSLAGVTNTALYSGDGIHTDIGSFADVTLTVDRATIGGFVTVAGTTQDGGNKGNGIFFGVEMSTALDTATQSADEFAGIGSFLQLYQRAGVGNLNVNNSLVSNNTLNGIELYGNGLNGNGLGAVATVPPTPATGTTPATLGTTALADRTYNTLYDGYGNLNANITNNTIVHNGISTIDGDGIRIEFLGRMGGNKAPLFFENAATGIYNIINITNNTISNNGDFGIFVQQNAAQQHFTTELDIALPNFDPPMPPPNFPIQIIDATGLQNVNNATQIPFGAIKDQFLLSNWMSLQTAQATILNIGGVQTTGIYGVGPGLLGNTIQGNGQNHILGNDDAIKMRVGTDTYLATNIRGNNLTGNVGNSLYVESFTQYNPVTFVSVPMQLNPSVHGTPATASGPGTPDVIQFDYTAQLYMNLNNNHGNAVNIVDPIVNFPVLLPGNVSGNGAFFIEDPQKNFPLPTNAGGVNRMVQLFEINNAAALDTANLFESNGVSQNLRQAFYNGNWYLRADNDPNFPSNNTIPTFPQDQNASFGNPFLGPALLPPFP